MRVDLVGDENGYFNGMYRDGVKLYDAKSDYLDLETAITISQYDGHDVYLHYLTSSAYSENYDSVGYPDNFSEFYPYEFSSSRKV